MQDGILIYVKKVKNKKFQKYWLQEDFELWKNFHLRDMGQPDHVTKFL